MRAKDFILDAIESPIGRDEVIAHKSSSFANTPALIQIHGLTLKKCVVDNDLWYGLLEDNTNNLVGILQLEQHNKYWQVRLAQIEEKYKSQGFGSFLYDYVVMNDGLTIISDVSRTSGSLGGSRGLWEKLYRQGRFTVCGYNIDTDEFIPLDNYSDISGKIYNQKEDIVWMATPKQVRETIGEMLNRINNRNKHRSVEWYGPSITDN